MAYHITEEEYQAICGAERATKDKRIAKRLQVLMLRYKGMSNPEIAKKLDLSSSRVSHLISEFKKPRGTNQSHLKFQAISILFTSRSTHRR